MYSLVKYPENPQKKDRQIFECWDSGFGTDPNDNLWIKIVDTGWYLIERADYSSLELYEWSKDEDDYTKINHKVQEIIPDQKGQEAIDIYLDTGLTQNAVSLALGILIGKDLT